MKRRRRREVGRLEYVTPPPGVEARFAYRQVDNDMNGQPMHRLQQTPEAAFAAALEIGRQMQALRMAQGMTRNQFATAIGYEPMAISHYENGHDFPSDHYIKRVCDTFRITESELLYGKKHQLSTPEAVKLTLEEQVERFKKPILDAFELGMNDQHEMRGDYAPLWSTELQYFEDSVDRLEGVTMTAEKCDQIKDEAFNYSTANGSAMYRCGVRDALQLILEALAYRAPVIQENRA